MLTHDKQDAIKHDIIFCLIRVPVALAAVVIVSGAALIGGGNPAQGVARAALAWGEQYMPSTTPGMISEHILRCPVIPVAKDHEPQPPVRPLPWAPTQLAKCHSLWISVSKRALETSIRTFITWTYLAACLVGIALVGLFRLAELFHSYRRRRAVLRYANEEWEESIYNAETRSSSPPVLH